jgi:hypothetical protein
MKKYLEKYKISKFVLSLIILSLFPVSNSMAMPQNKAEKNIINFLKKATAGIASVPGLSAFDIYRSLKIKSIGKSANTFLGSEVYEAKVTVYEDFQAIITLDENNEIVKITPDSVAFQTKPKFQDADTMNLKFKLEIYMDKSGWHYKKLRYQVLEVDKAGRYASYRTRVKGEYTVSISIASDSGAVLYYQNNMALAGLKVDKKPELNIISKNKEKWTGNMTSLLPLPKGAKFDAFDESSWNKYAGSDKVYLSDIRYKHMVTMGGQTTKFQGDYVSYLINPATGKLFIYNCVWTKWP